MWRAPFLVLAFSSILVHSRVTFITSEVLDDLDLKGTNMASFRCFSGCRVFSPTKNDNIVITDGTANVYKSLKYLAELKTGDFYELPASTMLYTLRNYGYADPSFVFYAVDKGASNYNTKVVYVDAATKFTIEPQTDSLLTVMSISGAVRFSNFQGDFQGALPTIHAVPFDSIADAACRPVYEANTASSVANTAFTILSPIATINFKSAGNGKSVQINGDAWSTTATGEGTIAVYVSPGYVGCDNIGDSLYTSLSAITSFDSSFSMSNSEGLHVVVNGDYSIEKEADAIELTVNNDVQKLFGKNQISKKYDETSFKIGVNWAKKEGSKDRFALQIDVMKGNGANMQTTTKSGHSIALISPFLMMLFLVMMRP